MLSLWLFRHEVSHAVPTEAFITIGTDLDHFCCVVTEQALGIICRCNIDMLENDPKPLKEHKPPSMDDAQYGTLALKICKAQKKTTLRT